MSALKRTRRAHRCYWCCITVRLGDNFFGLDAVNIAVRNGITGWQWLWKWWALYNRTRISRWLRSFIHSVAHSKKVKQTAPQTLCVCECWFHFGGCVDDDGGCGCSLLSIKLPRVYMNSLLHYFMLSASRAGDRASNKLCKRAFTQATPKWVKRQFLAKVFFCKRNFKLEAVEAIAVEHFE